MLIFFFFFSYLVFAQPIVSRAKPEMLKSHFIPTMEKLKKRSGKVVAEEEQLRMEGKTEVDSEEGTIRDEFAVLCRDLYALYPLLIRYVDNNRCWAISVRTDRGFELHLTVVAWLAAVYYQMVILALTINLHS